VTLPTRRSSRFLLRDPFEVPEQVFNAPRFGPLTADLTPISQLPALAVHAAWAPLIPDVYLPDELPA
jgi:hypothetical protein